MDVAFCWPIGSRHGWGVRGLNYALSWDGAAVSAMFEDAPELPPGDERGLLLAERVAQSRRFRDALLHSSTIDVTVDMPVLVGLGNDLTPPPVAGGRQLRGKPTIACPVFEDVQSVARNIRRLRDYDAVVVASRWNQQVLGELGVNARLVHEGIDPVIFNPSVRQERRDGKFRVFSGGKPEWRKGQDLVIETFGRFAREHADAVLVAAWGSPFGKSGADFEGRWEYGAPPGTHIGRPNFHAWVQRAGIRPEQFEFVEPRANWRMAEVYGSCDAALFPNRCEGGTNFVAMEAMACGVPSFVNAEHGQQDLMRLGGDGNHMARVDCVVGEMVAWLELRHSGELGERSYLGVNWTWGRHCREMALVISNA